MNKKLAILLLLCVALFALPAMAEETCAHESIRCNGVCEDCYATGLSSDNPLHSQGEICRTDDLCWYVCDECGAEYHYNKHETLCYMNGECLYCETTEGTIQVIHGESEIKTDANYHWKLCNTCGNVWDKYEHEAKCDNPGVCYWCNEAYTGDKLYHENTYMDYDEDIHWLGCFDCRNLLLREDHYSACALPERCAWCNAPYDGDARSHGEITYYFDDGWHWAICSTCGEWVDEGEHGTFCDGDGTCAWCDYEGQVDNVLHRDSRLESDEIGHWRVCDDCGNLFGDGEHWAVCTDPDECAECGAAYAGDHVEHAWESMEHDFDEEKHWGICPDCGEKVREEEHFALCTTPNRCDECDYRGEIDNVRHDEYYVDGNEHEHWDACDACGNTWERNPHEGTCMNPNECSYCHMTYDGSNTYHEWDQVATKGDAEYHWEECGACGETWERNPHESVCSNPNECSYCHMTYDGSNVYHDWDQVTTKGNAEYHWEECGACGEHMNEEEHWSDCTDEGTCTQCGEPYTGERLWHGNVEYTFNDEYHWGHCSECGELMDEGEHGASCNGDGTCEWCDYDGQVDNIASHSNTRWEGDENRHWIVCDDCGNVVGEGEHWSFCDDRGECVGCGAAYTGDNVGHKEIEYDFNEEIHWAQCDACGEIVDEGEHGANCDGDGTCEWCDYDGIVDNVLHGETIYIADGDYHSQICKNCGEEYGRGEHFGWCDNPGVCRGCGVECSDMQVYHDWSSDVQHDEQEHWRICDRCGEEFSRDEHCSVCNEPGVCMECGVEYTGDNVSHINYEKAADETHHWRYCSGCGETWNRNEHYALCTTPGECDYCGVEYTGDNVGHGEIELTWDDSRHYETCTDCGEVSWSQKHYAMCDTAGKCGYCEAEYTGGEVEHNWDYVSAERDETHHWYYCAYCDKTFWKSEHFAYCDTNGKCAECEIEYTGSNVEHNWDNIEIRYDDEHHYDYCTVCEVNAWTGDHYVMCGQPGECGYCGMEYDAVITEHDWAYVEIRYDDEKHYDYCTQCGISIWEGNHYTACDKPGVCEYCGQEYTGDNSDHNWDYVEIKHDDSQHWYYCDACGETFNKAEHYRYCDDEEGICSGCGVECDELRLKHRNKYAVIESNENEHWRICSYCNTEVSREGHYAMCGTEDKCEYCGEAYDGDEVYHYSNGNYKCDDEKHWQICIGCGEKIFEQVHYRICTDTDATKCEECGYKTDNLKDAHNDVYWRSDATYHWFFCDDCNQDSLYKETHEFVNGECELCGYVMEGNAVVITRQPEDVAVMEGETATVTFEAEGDGLTYAWYYKNAGGAKFYLTTTFTDNYYTAEMTEARNGRQVYCVVTDAYGNSVQTNIVTLSVALPELRIVSDLENVSACYGETVRVELEAEGEGLTYAWYYKNAGGSKFSLTKTFTGPEYSCEMNESRDGRQVYCEVTDAHGQTVTTAIATLSLVRTELQFVQRPDDVKVAEGKTVTVFVDAQGDALTYAWYHKFADDSEFALAPDFTGNSYTAIMSAENSGVQVYCEVKDVYGNVISTDPVVLSACFHENEDGNDYWSADENYHYYMCGFCDEELWSAEHERLCNDPEAAECLICGVATDNLSKISHGEAVQMQDASSCWYECSLCNEEIAETKKAHIVIDGVCKYCGRNAADCSVVISKQLENVTASHGQTVVLAVEAQGESLSYTWYIKKADDTKYATAEGDSYALDMTAEYDGAQVYCTVKDVYGCIARSNTVTLTLDKKELAITKQPEDVVAPSGETVTIAIEAEGDGLTYAWYFKNASTSKFSLTTTFTGNEYTTEMSASRDGRQVYCVVTDAYGNTVKTDTATMNMFVPAVAIINQPADVEVAEGETVTISFEAEGEGLTYAWYYKNAGASKFTLTKSFTGNTYTTEMTDARDGRQVYCVVTDAYGKSVQTNTVTMSMYAPAVVITKQPVDVEAAEGETVKISFEAEGKGLTYAWYYKNAGASKFSLTTTFTGNEYTTEMNASRDGRQVYCEVTDAKGNVVKTDVVTMSMKATVPPVVITKQPVDVEAAEGETVKISFEAEGKGLTYAWYYKNAGASKFSLTTTFTGNEYTTEMNASRDGRQVYCEVTDAKGNVVKTDVVTMSMSAPALVITKQPVDVEAAEGETVTISFEAEGEGLTYAWYFKNASASKFSLTTTFTGNEYTTEMSASRDGRQVYCVVTDASGNSVQTNTVTMSMSAPALVITKQPVDVEVAEGENVTISFEAEGEGLTYAWYFKNASASKFSLTTTFTGNEYTTEMSASRDGRQVYCVVTDANGNSVQTNTVTMSMKEEAAALKITKQPADASAAIGAVVKTTVEAEGEGLTYTWYVKDPSGTKFSKSSVTKNTYSYTMTAAKSGRQVYCVITDAAGNTVQTNTVTLSAAAAIKITKQPADVQAAVGVTAKTTVEAEGDSLTYTWYVKDPGASSYTKSSIAKNTYSFKMTEAKSGRQVYCVITDANGDSVTSDVATLSVPD